MQEKENVLRIFKEAKEAVKKEDADKLKELSDQTIHTASTTQDPNNIAVATIVYSLSKIVGRKEYRKYPGWNKFYKDINNSMDNFIKYLKIDDEKKFNKSLVNLRKAINKLSGKLKKYVQDVFVKAKINKASKIYEHGISMEKTASLLGITMFDLASYAGQKEEISEQKEAKTLSVKQRIKTAMEMFR